MARRPIGVKTLLLAAAAVLAATLTACGDEEPGLMADDDQPAALSLDHLDGRAFSSVRVDGHRLVDDTRIHLGFKGRDVSVEAGCNHLFGKAALEGDTMRVSNMGGTEMGCPPGLHDQDAWVTEFLGAGPTVALDGDTLTLSGGDVVIELVEAEEPAAPTGEPRASSSSRSARTGPQGCSMTLIARRSSMAR